jgi:hypothetical protein
MNKVIYKVNQEEVAGFLERAVTEALLRIADAARAQQRGKREFDLVMSATCEVAELFSFDQWNEVQRLFDGLWRNGAWLRRKGATKLSNPIMGELVTACVRELLQLGHTDENFKRLSRTVFNCIVADMMYDPSTDPCGDCHDCDSL